MNLIIYQGTSPDPNVEQMNVETPTKTVNLIYSALSVNDKLTYDEFLIAITSNFYEIVIENSLFDMEVGRATSQVIGQEINVADYAGLSQSYKTAIINFNNMIINM